MKKLGSVLFLAFASFAVLFARADDSISYYSIDVGGYDMPTTYFFYTRPGVSMDDVLSRFGLVWNDEYFGYATPDYDAYNGSLLNPIEEWVYNRFVGSYDYLPYDDSPSYASSDPSAPVPSGGGDSGSSSGFDPVSLLDSSSSLLTVIASFVGGLFTAAAAIYLAFIGWRNSKKSFHIVEDRNGCISLSKIKW